MASRKRSILYNCSARYSNILRWPARAAATAIDDGDKLHGYDSDCLVENSDDAIDDDEELNCDRHGDDDDDHLDAADQLDSSRDDDDDSAVPTNCCFKDSHVARLTALYSWFKYDKTTGASSCMACSSYPATVAGPSCRSCENLSADRGD